MALAAALSAAAGDAVLKARFSSLSPLGMAIVRSTAPLPFLVPALAFFVPWPKTDFAFWATLAVLLPLEITALVLYMQALRVSPLSLSIPFLAFTPVFILLTGWVLLGETVTVPGAIGVLLTVAGAYVINIRKGVKGILAPLTAILTERGSRLMLGVAAIYAVTSVLGKKAVLHSGPVFFACFYFLVLGIATPPLMHLASQALPAEWGKKACAWKADLTIPWLMVGLAQTVMVLAHMKAISLAQAAYIIAVKRTSLLFSVLFGWIIFGEVHILERLLGATIMLAGVFLIVLWG